MASSQDTLDRYRYIAAQPERAAQNGDVHNLQDQYNLEAYQSFVQLMGREPTASEFAQVLPAFQGGDGRINGQAFLAQYAEQERNSPDAVRGRAPQYSGDINRLFQEYLGRDATQDELVHFGSGLASGQVDSFQVGQMVQQLPEYRESEDKRFRSGLNEELQGFEQERFQDVQEDILSRFVRGGIQHSPNLENALLNAATELTKEREKFLSSLSADQYGSNKGLARSDYENTLNQYIQNQGYSRNRNTGLQDVYRDRAFGDVDFSRQEAAYSRYANQGGGGGGSGAGAAFGPLIGAGIGAFAAAPTGGMSIPMGAYLGSQFGSAGGGAADYAFR